MKAYVLSIAGAVLISAIVSILMPEGRMGKFIRGTTKLFLIVVLVSPFVSWMGGKGFIFTDKEIGTDEEYLLYCAALLSQKDEEELVLWLNETYGVEAEVEVSRSPDGFRHEKIKVVITDFGINEDRTHIDIVADVKRALAQRYGCPAEVS